MKAWRKAASALAASLLTLVVLAAGVHAAPRRSERPASELMRRIMAARHPVTSQRPASSSARRSGFECVTEPTEARNVSLDCPDEYGSTTDEPSIAVDPNDPDHIVTASLNNPWPYQTIQVATSFDGGETWTIADLPRRDKTINCDPWLAFDVKRGTVVLAFE